MIAPCPHDRPISTHSIRAIRWQHAIDNLIGRDGHTPSQP